MIKLNHLEKFFNRGKQNEIHVINDVTLELPEKGMVAVFGQSGCGKTTLLSVIGGLDKPKSGKVLVCDTEMSPRNYVTRNRDIGIIFQNYNLNREETVFDNVANALRLCGITDEKVIAKRVYAALRNVGMERFDKRFPDTLSGGQQQRVAIARAIVKNPSIILADEPTGNLDEANTILVMDILRAISREHLVLLVTHETNLVDCYCDMVIELRDGSIAGVRYNEETGGYVARNRNDIFLGEMEKCELSDGNAEISFYGESPDQPVKMTLVNYNGRLFLKLDTPKVTILDESSEVTLREGVYAAKTEQAKREDSIDMSELPSVEGKDYGRLFRFLQSIKTGYRANFVANVKQKGKKRLRRCLLLFGALLVMATAVCGTALRDWSRAASRQKSNILWGIVGHSASEKEKRAALLDPASGIIDISVVDQVDPNAMQDKMVSFYPTRFETIGRFETAKAEKSGVNLEIPVISEKVFGDAKVLAGTAADLGGDGVVLSKAAAEQLLKESAYAYIRSYSNLLGMQCEYEVGKSVFVGYVKGIVDTEEAFMYVSDRTMDYLSRTMMTDAFDGIIDDYDGYFGVKPGECTMIYTTMPRDGETMVEEGSKLQFNGIELTVSKRIDAYYDWSKAEEGAGTVYYPGEFVIGEEIPAEYFGDGYSDFMKQKFDLAAHFTGCSGLTDRYSGVGLFENMNIIVVLNPADFHSGSRVAGETSTRFVGNWDYHDMTIDELTRFSYCSNRDYIYYQVYTKDPKTTEAYLRDVLASTEVPAFLVDQTGGERDAAAVYTPQDRYEKSLEKVWGRMVWLFSVWLAVFVLMCVCMYFIMRSAILGKVREIGIYRAIGVSGKNVAFRFAVETGVVVTLSVIIGYLIASVAIGALTASSTYASSILYYPWWLAGLTLLLLYGICILCGILPVLRLNRKTPSEILAKYDI